MNNTSVSAANTPVINNNGHKEELPDAILQSLHIFDELLMAFNRDTNSLCELENANAATMCFATNKNNMKKIKERNDAENTCTSISTAPTLHYNLYDSKASSDTPNNVNHCFPKSNVSDVNQMLHRTIDRPSIVKIKPHHGYTNAVHLSKEESSESHQLSMPALRTQFETANAANCKPINNSSSSFCSELHHAPISTNQNCNNHSVDDVSTLTSQVTATQLNSKSHNLCQGVKAVPPVVPKRSPTTKLTVTQQSRCSTEIPKEMTFADVCYGSQPCFYNCKENVLQINNLKISSMHNDIGTNQGSSYQNISTSENIIHNNSNSTDSHVVHNSRSVNDMIKQFSAYDNTLTRPSINRSSKPTNAALTKAYGNSVNNKSFDTGKHCQFKTDLPLTMNSGDQTLTPQSYVRRLSKELAPTIQLRFPDAKSIINSRSSSVEVNSKDTKSFVIETYSKSTFLNNSKYIK